MSSSCPIFRRDITKPSADSFIQVNHLLSTTASIRAQVSLVAENARLRRENERLRMEREILKKTLRIFSEAPR